MYITFAILQQIKYKHDKLYNIARFFKSIQFQKYRCCELLIESNKYVKNSFYFLHMKLFL